MGKDESVKRSNSRPSSSLPLVEKAKVEVSCMVDVKKIEEKDGKMKNGFVWAFIGYDVLIIALVIAVVSLATK